MPRAVSLTGELLKDYESEIESLELVPSSGGRFEVSVNGELIYSKSETGRHAEPGEVRSLFQAKIKA
jgi:selenoprotein W-related protein